MPPPPYVAILDVGHGNSTVLVDSQGVVVIDAGRRSALLAFLRQQGITRIDVVLVSHADEDHIGGLVALLASGEITIGRVRLNTDSAKDSMVWNDLLYELDRAQRLGGLDFQPALTTDMGGQYDQGEVRVEIVGPSAYLAARGPGSTDTAGNRLTTNSISAVVRLVFRARPVVLLCGDLDEIGLHELVRIGADLRAPSLVFPHHGGRSGQGSAASFVEQLIRLVAPSCIVFSIGRGRHGTPRPEVVAAALQHGRAVRIICTQLSEHCAAVVPKTSPTHLTGAFAQGSEKGKCCGGTLLIQLADVDSLSPTAEPHLAFIATAAPTALCRSPRSA